MYFNYINLSNNDLSLVLHCRLKEFYVYKKACEIAISFLYANHFKGFVEISLRKSEDDINKLLSICSFRMIKPDISIENVNVNVNNVVFVLNEIRYNYLSRINALGHDPYYEDVQLNERVEQINMYFDKLINQLYEQEYELKRRKVSKK